ncbi:MAG: hypothetical protein GY862_24595 [Gammaproteobacteria bacterium]|nr:hypothetical protein [Gammaproteobacteria bacterium]
MNHIKHHQKQIRKPDCVQEDALNPQRRTLLTGLLALGGLSVLSMPRTGVDSAPKALSEADFYAPHNLAG